MGLLAGDIALIGDTIAPIVGNAVATIVNGVKDALAQEKGDLLAKISGKSIEITIKIPDLTK